MVDRWAVLTVGCGLANFCFEVSGLVLVRKWYIVYFKRISLPNSYPKAGWCTCCTYPSLLQHAVPLLTKGVVD